MQRERRRNPYPWTWEPPAAAATGLVLLLVAGVQLGRSLANLFAGAGWTWPDTGAGGVGYSSPLGAAFWTSLPGVLTGEAHAGLATPVPAGLAGPRQLWACVGATEAVLLVAAGWAIAHVYRRWGPGRMRGMATTAEAEKLLGITRLRKVSAIVRPDLHGKQATTSAPVRRDASDGRPARPAAWPWPESLAPEPPHHQGNAMKLRMHPHDVGWRIGKAHEPRGGQLWVPWDRTAGVIGPQGSGKTLDILTPALLGAPGAALVTLTKVEDLLLSLTARSRHDRPCVVLDPFGLAEGVAEELVWDPIAGCVDPKVAERRAKAFTAGTIKGAIHGGTGDDAARFYAAESAKVLQAYFHAAALAGKTLDDVLRWVANPLAASDPGEILRRHPHAEPFWHGLLHGALNGDDRTAGNTITTVQQAMSLFFQAQIRRRCIPGPGRPATDLAAVIRRRGTIYLLGREDPYASASPLMTAVAEHVLDTGLLLASNSPWGGRWCPPLLSCLDELPSTAPLPTLHTRMSNERALGLSFIYAAQTRAQLTSLFGEHESRSLLGLTNVLVMFGGSKDVAFNQEISDLLGTVRVSRSSYQTGGHHGGGRTISGDDIPIMRPEEVRQLPERHALVIAENGKPIIAKLHRCVEGKDGQQLLAEQRMLRERLTDGRRVVITPQARSAAAMVEARRLGLVDEASEHR